MNILDVVKSQLTSAVVGKISDFLGEDAKNTTNALGSAMPTLLGGIMEKASTTQGASDLLNLVKKEGNDGSLLSNLGNVLGSSSGIEGLASNGSGILNTIFGDKVGSIAKLIGNVGGISGSSASSLLGLAAPILMNVIGKQTQSQGLGVSGLANLLMGQKDAVTAALPAGVGSLLNVNSLGDFLGTDKKVGTINKTINKTVSTVTNDDDDNRGGGMGWLPWLLLGALALGALFYFKSCRNTAANSVEMAKDSVVATVDSTVSSVSSLVKKKLSTGFELSFGEKSIENELIGFIEDGSKGVDKKTWFNFRNLNFKTGSADLDSSSVQEVKNIAEILKAFPNVAIKVGGYTDNVGDDNGNMKLSASRANTVLGSLVNMGIDKARLVSEGYGEQHPVGDNNTEEGRAANRRIAVNVTKK